MTQPPTAHMLLAILEDTLVAEFRAYEALVRMTKDERRLLPDGDVQALLDLIGQKERLLDEIDHLERKRQATLAEWARLEGRVAPPANLLAMLPELDALVAQRLGHLRDGILVLIEQQRDLARGNKLLVNQALQQVQAVRDFLINLCDTPRGYQPPGQVGAAYARVTVAVEQMA
jgi:flagellar biosynthesis/type III secretory pathway chaperone